MPWRQIFTRTSIQCFLVKSFNIEIQVLTWILSHVTHLGKVYLDSAQKKVDVEGGHHMIPTLNRTWLEAEVPGIRMI